MNVIKSETVKLKAKRTFIKKGTCSRTFFYILNREFGFPVDEEEHAVDPLAGGILQQGYQCGMLWGASMAVGGESYRRNGNNGKAIGIAIKATQNILESFSNRTSTIECEDITKTDFNNKWSFAKYMLSGKFVHCYKLTGKWAPEAIKAAHEGLSQDQIEISPETRSCASEVIKQMGGTEKEVHMVAGFAGGLGLSGSGCGALAATIWKTILELVRKKSWKYSMSDPITEKILKKFYEVTDYKMKCSEICGKQFGTIDEHTEFIKNGGCSNLIDFLAKLE
jgi:hypothetical protein